MTGHSSMRSPSWPLYMLFVHYALKGEPDDPTEIARITSDLAYLHSILSPNSSSRWQGYAFVFIDRGWTELVERKRYIGDGLALAQQLLPLHLRAQHLQDRIHIVTVLDLHKLIAVLDANVSPELRGRLYEFLVGANRSLFYDGPKVIEASIRIANIGRHTPIFRFDDDVLFYGNRVDRTNWSEPLWDHETKAERKCAYAEQTRTKLELLAEHYVVLSRNPEINYFLFSGGYIDRKLMGDFESSDRDFTLDDVEAAINGVVTRLVQLANVVPARQLIKDLDLTAFESAHARRQEEILRQYPADISPKALVAFARQLCEIGSNPFTQVISGAGLCLSDSAILDLPPYSNMRQNVVWIDDHLKYALHHELRHFGFVQHSAQVARVAEASFPQLRHAEPPTLANVRWHLARYLPRLILGCVADAWLRADKRLKLKLRSLQEEEFSEVIGTVPGFYAQVFERVEIGGWQSDEERESFKQELWRVAIERLKEIVEFCKRDEYNGTFLRLFVVGVGARMADFAFDEVWRRLGFLPSFAADGLEQAVFDLPGAMPDLPSEEPGDGGRSLRESLRLLVEDFANYVDFVRFWRHFVFSVRSMLNWSSTRRHVEWLLPPVELP